MDLPEECYRTIKYVQFNKDGDVYITGFATKDKRALEVVLKMIWDKFTKEIVHKDHRYT
jgi:hypothetical protein